MPDDILGASVTSMSMRPAVAVPLSTCDAIGTAKSRRGLGSKSLPSITSVVTAPVCNPRSVMLVICGAAAGAIGGTSPSKVSAAATTDRCHEELHREVLFMKAILAWLGMLRRLLSTFIRQKGGVTQPT